MPCSDTKILSTISEPWMYNLMPYLIFWQKLAEIISPSLSFSIPFEKLSVFIFQALLFENWDLNKSHSLAKPEDYL